MLRGILFTVLLALAWATTSAAAGLDGTQAGAGYESISYDGIAACGMTPIVGQAATVAGGQGQFWPAVLKQTPRILDGSLQLAQRCCKICKKGKACGNSCINRSYTCHQPPGCACDG
ncbi:MAG: hypothetical protein ACFCUT_06840 [Kiloniellaceae bacterium]